MNKKYHVRYKVEEWDREPEPEDCGGEEVTDNVIISKTDYGYTDRLFLASILLDTDGEVESVLFLDSKDGPRPSKEVLMLIKKQIEHHLKHHI